MGGSGAAELGPSGLKVIFLNLTVLKTIFGEINNFLSNCEGIF
jgi:hypothetical protein